MQRLTTILFSGVFVGAIHGCADPTRVSTLTTTNIATDRQIEDGKKGTDEIILVISQYPAASQQDSICVRLANARLRDLNLTKQDIVDALTPTSLNGNLLPPVPEPDHIYLKEFGKIERYPDIILRASPDGNIVRLKDVATVELRPSETPP